MSHTPNQSTSHARSPSVESTTSNQHQRRVSTHSLGISYAYGAPSPQQPNTSTTSPRSKRTNRKPSEEPLVRPRQQRELSVEETGRAIEPAAVRYSRLQAQRKQQTETSGGGTTSSNSNFNKMASLNNTSVNIATAFKAATSGNGPAMVKAGRREDFPPLEERSENRENDERREEGSSKQVIPEGVDGSASKKRKKNGIKDPSFRPSQREGETESSEEYSEEHESTNGKKGKKRAKVRSEDEQGLADDPSIANSKASPRKPRRSHKPADPSYKPSADPSFHPNNTSSDPDSDEDDEGRRRRSRSKSGKGGIGVDAIPRGIRDGEVWYGKGKKKRTSRGGKSSGTPSSSRRRSGESVETEKAGDREDEEEEDPQRDLGGMESQDHDHGTPDPEAQEEDEEEDEQQTPPAHAGNQSGGLVSYFLRRKSPSPNTNTNAPPPEDNGASLTSTRKGFSFPSLSPFRNRSHDPSPDPAFAAFDRSLHASSHSQSHSQDSLQSIDELSHLRNSSYDYSEEEKMVQIAEEQYRRNKAKQQAQLTPAATAIPARLFTSNQRQIQTPGTPIGMTPAPKSGAYPLTPGSPVNALQRNRANVGGGGKNRLPAPPSMLGQQASSGSRMERDEREGVWGRRCGSAVRPVVEMVGRFRRKLQDPLLDWGKIFKALGGALGVVTLLLAIRYADSTSNRLPHFGSHPSPSTYSPPTTPPDSIDALVSRLSSLESAVGKLSTSTDSDRSTAKQDRSLLERVTDQIHRLERNLEEGQNGVRREFDQLEKERSKDARQVEGSVKDVKEDLGSLIRRVQELSAARETDSTRLDSLETGVESTTKELETLSAQLGKLSKEVEFGLKSERITQLAIAAIEKKLPGKIGVRLDSSGRLEIDPTFWRYLKEAFVDRKEVEKTVENKLKAFEKKSAASGGGGGGLFGSKDKDKKDSQTVVAQQPPSWDDFLSSNEESLRTWIASDLESRVGGDAFVSKKTFLDLLQREIKLLKRDFESKANENFEQMGQELLSKVAKQEEMRKKDSAYAQHHQQRQPGGSSTSINGPVTIKSTDGQNVTAVISSLVDSALLRYSKDVLARPDYALFTSGGRVIRSLTSQTYEPHPLSRSRAALSWITGASAPRGRPAVTALHPDTAPGSCWPFEGQRGQIGIQLSRRVVPSDITIEHISRDVALDGDVSSAPKDFEVWAVVEGQEHVVKLAQYRQQEIETKRSAQSSTSLEDALNNEEPASLPPTPNHLLLAVGTYDPLAISPVQTFPVTPMARQLGIPVQIVVVKILSNQGESAYTCLYRVRISGSTEAQLVNSSL